MSSGRLLKDRLYRNLRTNNRATATEPPKKSLKAKAATANASTAESQVVYFEHPHLRDLDWALQGVSGVGHSRETLGLGTPGVSEKVSEVGHSRETLGLLGTPGTLWVGHSRESLGVDRARRRVPGVQTSILLEHLERHINHAI